MPSKQPGGTSHGSASGCVLQPSPLTAQGSRGGAEGHVSHQRLIAAWRPNQHFILAVSTRSGGCTWSALKHCGLTGQIPPSLLPEPGDLAHARPRPSSCPQPRSLLRFRLHFCRLLKAGGFVDKRKARAVRWLCFAFQARGVSICQGMRGLC